MVAISDCTLRDARNAPGMYFSVPEAVKIAKKLDTLSIEEIKAGLLNGSTEAAQLIDAVNHGHLNASVSSMFLYYNTSVTDKSLTQIFHETPTGSYHSRINLSFAKLFLLSKYKFDFLIRRH